MNLELIYIELCAGDFVNLQKLFSERLSFKLCGKRENENVIQCLWNHDNLKFVTTNFKNIQSEDLEHSEWTDEYVIPHVYPSIHKFREHAGSVYNVAFRVHDLNMCVEHITRSGGTVLKPMQTITDHNGYVQIAVVKSCIGNVIHTLVESSNYHGTFLPQFEEIIETKSNINVIVTSKIRFVGIDHLAFAVDVGHSQQIIEWYEQCFLMHRYYVSSQDSDGGGFVVEIGDIGVRLKAMSGEVGLMSCDTAVKFVLAESLHQSSSDQISTFIRVHGGEGLQHIGLMTDDILTCVSALTHNGMTFTEPPPTYYSEVGKLKEIESMGEDAQMLEKYGILIDTDDPLSNGYLMQKFTKPIFGVDTFFFEIIQRKNGCRGFGAGNVSALWKSFQAYLQQIASSQDS